MLLPYYLDLKTRIVLVGLGYVSKYHFQVIQAIKSAVVVAAVQRNQLKGKEFCSIHGIPYYFKSVEELINWGKFDAAIVAVSHTSTVEVSRKLLKGSWPCLIEKPVGFSANETKKLANLAHKKKTWGMVGVNRRFYSTINKALELVRQNGGLRAIVVEQPERIHESTHWKVSTKVLDKWFFVNGIHLIDLMCYACGIPKTVRAIHRSWKKRRHAYDALMEFHNGTVGHYISQWYSPGNWTLNLYANNLRIQFQNLESGMILRTGKPPKKLPIDKVDLKYKPGFYGQMQAFISGVRVGKPPINPACLLDEATRVMKVLESINQS